MRRTILVGLLVLSFAVPAAVNAQQGVPVWDVVAKQLGSGKPLNAPAGNVALRGVAGNPGIAE